MQPVDLGLPEKFSDFREGQSEIAYKIATSGRRFSLLSASTGTGKSLIYMAVAQLLGERALVLTATKGLQQQLMLDFEQSGLHDVRGQSNYRCVALDSGGNLTAYGPPGTTCDEGPCHVGVFCDMKKDGGCPYYDAVAAASTAPIVVTNYAYWMTINRHADPLSIGEFGLVVLDEAHAAPDLLADFCTVELGRRDVKSLLSLSLPPINEGVQAWATWAQEAYEICRSEYAKERSKFQGSGDRRRITKRLIRLTDLGRGLGELAKAYEWKRAEAPRSGAVVPGTTTDWEAERTKNGLKFSPVWAHAYAEECLFVSVPRVLLCSATLQKSAAKYLGIQSNDMEFIEFDAGFDPRRRPLIWIPTTKVDRKMVPGQKIQWINRIDQIISKRTDRKGIIHTRSYERAKFIVNNSKFSHLMISHTSRTARTKVEEFKRAEAPAILVSPSMEAGYDFPGDYCRYQILVKVPFPDGRPPVMKARTRSDRKYPHYVAALSIIQCVGRGMRSSTDWCENFIIDDHWAWFRRAASRQFPRWFRKSIKRQNSVPEPMDKSRGYRGKTKAGTMSA